jgi:hypothetical protein
MMRKIGEWKEGEWGKVEGNEKVRKEEELKEKVKIRYRHVGS